MDVIFAPDWRNGVPYQRLLAEALGAHGVNVRFLQNYKRVLPLTRLLARQKCDILHLHWPEAYYPRKDDVWDWFRRARFPIDLRGALKHCTLATTAHNLHAHNRASESFAHRNTSCAHNRAGVVFAHSEIAKQKLISEFAIAAEKVHVVPHGDLSVTLGTPLPQPEARAILGLGAGKVALMFGAVEPYKGQEEIIDWWRTTKQSATLAIIGKPITETYGGGIAARIGDGGNIRTQFEWMPDEQLRLWLSAVDIVVFNYREIFTSGAANLARSWGIPILLPSRLDTVVLDEPSPFVRRFDGTEADFATQLAALFTIESDFAAAKHWRASCSWDRVAALTAAGYRAALGS